MSKTINCPKCGLNHVVETEIKPNDDKVYRGNCKSCNFPIKFKVPSDILEKESITFKLNGTTLTVDNDQLLETSLNSYLRDQLHMTGTKVTCREGGCGACVVNIKTYDYPTKSFKNMTVNSCLYPLYSCDGLEITTIEGVGGKSKGFHEIQKRLADNNGSQCGWCSAGMVMNMYSLLLKNQKPTKAEIEASYDGNICRCTGYRPIMDAMKSFSVDEKPIDIEELTKLPCCKSTNQNCKSTPLSTKRLHLIKEDNQNEWITPKTLDDLYSILDQNRSKKYRFVGGNTGVGVFKNDGKFDVFIDIKNTADLYKVDKTDDQLTFGSALTIASLIDLMKTYASSAGFEYLSTIAFHLVKIANVAVRNSSTWAGNLALKHRHQDFPSDIFISFVSVNAQLTIIGPDNRLDKNPIKVSVEDFLNLDLTSKMIYSVSFRPLEKSRTFLKTFKIMPRYRNAHAYVNAGFNLNLNPVTGTVESMPTIVYGGITSKFIHAKQTELYLYGKNLNDQKVLDGAFAMLNSELDPEYDPALSTPEYRKSLAIALFYKFMIYCNDKYVSSRYHSGQDSVMDARPVSTSKQQYPTDPSMYPVTKAMTKLNAYYQTSGEAPYVYDLKPFPNQLYGAFITSTVANCKISNLDTSKASQMPGVVSIILAKDIPGLNNVNVPSFLFTSSIEPLFADSDIDYAGQSIGLVVAETQQQAEEAVKSIQIEYSNQKKPILTLKDAIEANSFHDVKLDDFNFGDAQKAISSSDYQIEGEFYMDAQYHFYMESQVAIANRIEDQYDVYSSTQWTDLVQNVVAQVLGLKNASAVNVIVKQLGGAYGGKITRANYMAAAAALACKITDKPVRVALNLSTVMEMIGKRNPYYVKYKVGFQKTGKISGIDMQIINDGGCLSSDNAITTVYIYSDNAYNIPNWHISTKIAKTHTATNTACRSPDNFPAISMMEYIIEHVSKAIKLDSLDVRLTNLYKINDVTPYGQPLPYFIVDKIISQLRSTSDYDKRAADIVQFNKNNRWKKKGISFVPLKWGLQSGNVPVSAIVSIYVYDGSIVVGHGGIEMGQGIHTKLAQVCAYTLNVPMEKVSIKFTSNFINPNGLPSGGSVTSELASLAVIGCCKELNDRLDPIRKTMPPDYTWLDLVTKAAMSGVDLTSRKVSMVETPDRFTYDTYGAAVGEVIVDVLTGETQIPRVDILYDCGKSTNSTIDIGQAEGAFIMGMGFWMFEKPKYDPDTGVTITNGTWEYKPPLAQDIPIDFRITLLDNNPNPKGVLGSKAVGEPPLCLSPCLFLAIKNAIEAARSETGNADFFHLNAPSTYDVIQQKCLVDPAQFKLSD